MSREGALGHKLFILVLSWNKNSIVTSVVIKGLHFLSHSCLCLEGRLSSLRDNGELVLWAERKQNLNSFVPRSGSFLLKRKNKNNKLEDVKYSPGKKT